VSGADSPKFEHGRCGEADGDEAVTELRRVGVPTDSGTGGILRDDALVERWGVVNRASDVID
jgi:hypothetical protein